MKVSIVTVVYNNKETILEAIESVRKQTYKNIEYIIIDGQSSDGTADLIKHVNNGPDIFISEPDKGIYDAMNKGISMATGDIIGILNSDDFFFDENIITDVVAHFNIEPGLHLLFGDLIYVDKNNINKIRRYWSSQSYYDKFFEHGHVPPHTALFVRSQVYKIAGLFNLNYSLAADYEFMLRIFKKHLFKSKYIPQVMIKMRLGGASNNSFKNIIKGNVEILRAWKDNGLRIPILLMPYRIVKRLTQFTNV